MISACSSLSAHDLACLNVLAGLPQPFDLKDCTRLFGGRVQEAAHELARLGAVGRVQRTGETYRVVSLYRRTE